MLLTGKTPSDSLTNVTAPATATPVDDPAQTWSWWQLFYSHLTAKETTVTEESFGETARANTTTAAQIWTALKPTTYVPSRRSMKSIWRHFTA